MTSNGHAALSRTVTEADTAAAWGEEFPRVASTPFVLGLAEVACHRAVASGLEPGQLTVGAGATIKHFAASEVGAVLTAFADLKETAGNRLTFEVEVRDGDRPVAKVEHRRVIVGPRDEEETA